MAIIRLTIILVFLASLVLLVMYLFTRNQRYLTLLKQIVIYTCWMLVVVGLLYLIARVIRL